MMKKIAIIVALVLMAGSAHAQMGSPDQRPHKGNPFAQGKMIASYLRDAVNVMQPPFNAACNGRTDDTPAFLKALATGNPVYVPSTSTCCAVNALLMPSNSGMIGDTGPWYSTFTGSRSCLTATPTATTMINVNAVAQPYINNIDVICSTTGSFSAAVNGVSGGSTDMLLSDMSIRYCGNGGVGDTTNQTATMTADNVTIYGSGQVNTTAGWINIVDSHVKGGFTTSNANGFYFPSGSNDNDIEGVKNEFNVRFGYLFDSNSARTVVRGGVCDNNAFGCARFNAADTITFDGTVAYRNGRGTDGNTFTYGQNQQFYFNGGAKHIVLSGINTKAGLNDGGGGTLGPPYAVTFNASSDDDITIGDSDLTGFTTAPILYNGTPTNLRLQNVAGVQNSKQLGQQDFTGEITVNSLAAAGTPVITNSGTPGATAWSYNATAFTSTGFHSAASAAGSTATGNATLSGANCNVITLAGPVTGASYSEIRRTVVGTSPTTTGLIGKIYEGQTALSDCGSAGDSSVAPATDTTGVIGVGTTAPAYNVHMKYSSSGTVTPTALQNSNGGTSSAVCQNFVTSSTDVPTTNGLAQICSTRQASGASNLTIVLSPGSAGAPATALTIGGVNGAITQPASRVGTFVCTGAGTITISNTLMTATSPVIISMNAQGGTITTPPAMKTVTAATGFSVLCGTTDTSTYNYVIMN